MNPEQRLISNKTMPAGKSSCNAKLGSRDGYCQQRPVKPFHRCKAHGGKKALDIFSKSLGLEQAAKLKTLLDDTLSMDNELASGKVLLVAALEDWERARYVLNHYMDNIPMIPDNFKELEDDEQLMYKQAISLHQEMLSIADEREKLGYVKVEKLLKVVTEGVAKNNRIKEGVKFSMDVGQIRGILKMQLEVMAENCAGCPSLKNIIRTMRERVKDIPVDPHISKENRKLLGARKYRENLEMVEKIGESYPVE